MQVDMKAIQFTVRLTEPFNDRLKLRAVLRGVSRMNMAQQAIYDYLDRTEAETQQMLESLARSQNISVEQLTSELLNEGES